MEFQRIDARAVARGPVSQFAAIHWLPGLENIRNALLQAGVPTKYFRKEVSQGRPNKPVGGVFVLFKKAAIGQPDFLVFIESKDQTGNRVQNFLINFLHVMVPLEEPWDNYYTVASGRRGTADRPPERSERVEAFHIHHRRPSLPFISGRNPEIRPFRPFSQKSVGKPFGRIIRSIDNCIAWQPVTLAAVLSLLLAVITYHLLNMISFLIS